MRNLPHHDGNIEGLVVSQQYDMPSSHVTAQTDAEDKSERPADPHFADLFTINADYIKWKKIKN